jgi:aspartyl-tRNA(Asn)/glutamyl-tRNA(Gln) amidotransferase subunit A
MTPSLPDGADMVRYASIRELAALLGDGRASAVELVDESLAAMAAEAPRFNALASLMPERARAEAAAADRLIASGDSALLCGIPYAVKDIIAAVGAPTTWGSPMFADQVFDSDAVVVQRLKSRGAALVAKLALSEFAGGGEPARAGASLHGQGRNPWDPSRYSGGSSSGSAIAVSLGLVPFALGTETGGSVVGPATFTGITGMRTTHGLVPRDGVMTLSWSLDKVGPLARSAEDCAIVLDAIADVEGEAAPFQAAVDAAAPPALRVAWTDVELDEVAPSIRPTLERAIDEFRAIFPRFVEAELDRDQRYIDALIEVIHTEGAYEFRDHLIREDFRMTDAQQQAKLAGGLTTPAIDYLRAMHETRSAAIENFERIFARADVIVSASRAAVAQPLDAERKPRDATKLSELLRAAANLAGLPGIAIPCGLSEEGLPVGLHIVGPRGSDALLLQVAAAYQRSTDHHRLRPPDGLVANP